MKTSFGPRPLTICCSSSRIELDRCAKPQPAGPAISHLCMWSATPPNICGAWQGAMMATGFTFAADTARVTLGFRVDWRAGSRFELYIRDL